MMEETVSPTHYAPEHANQQGTTAYGGHAMVSHDNRRNDPRYPMCVQVKYPRRNAFFFEYTRNISRGGMFIATDKPMELGERFTFELQIPGEDEPMRLVGEVRWRVTPDEVSGMKGPVKDLETGMGIAFIFDSNQDKTDFEHKVTHMLHDAFGPELTNELLRTSPVNK